MGVDLQTYRAKIGTFRHSVGTDVLTIVCYVNFSGGLKTVGSVLFIWILLLIAGIESNPGPKDDDGYEDQTIPKPTAIKITGLPDTVNKDRIESFFEGKGGPVKSVIFDPSTLSANIEFEKAEYVEIVLSQRPIAIKGKTVNIEIYDFKENRSTSDQMESLNLDVKLQETLSSSAEFESLRSDGGSDEYVSKSDEISQVLHRFGLEKYFKEKISLRDAVVVDHNETETERHYTVKDLPLLILKQLMNANSGALDISVYKLETEADKSTSLSSEDCATPTSISANETIEVSPLDLFVLAFQSSNPDLKQVLCQKLYLCKLAVPFLYYDASTSKTVISSWPLRSLVVQSNIVTNSTVSFGEIDILQMPTFTVTFARFGRPSYSKSKLLNSIVSESETSTFFNKDCLFGSVPKHFTSGYAEIFWVPEKVDCHSKMSKTLTYMNLRGDISRHFSDQHRSLFACLSDLLVLCVDQRIVNNSADMLKNLFSKFQGVLLIVNNPNCPRDKREKERILLAVGKMEKCHFDCVLTHRDSQKINLKTISRDISEYINKYIASNTLHPIPLEIRLNHRPQEVLTDETQECMQALCKAEEVFKTMMEVPSKDSWLAKITPVQFIYSKSLGTLLKEMHSSKKDTDDIEQQIVSVRTEQQKHVTTPIKQFINCLQSYAEQPIAIHYFLTWLKIFIEREQRQTLSQLKIQRTELENQYQHTKKLSLSNSVTLKQIEVNIKEIEDKLKKVDFGISNLFREIAHIYDAVIILQNAPDSFDLPSVDRVVYTFANLFANGYIIELLDSCNLFIPMAWIKLVFNKVNEIIEKKKVLSLSVLGLQSSGKSTLLNTMFGVHNATRSGRCTRGITAQLVPVSFTTYTHETKFDYILVIDTEGLRAPEFKGEIYKRDNKIATVITGLGDITILNMMGENTTEIRDVLQAIVHAFLRLHLSNPNVDIKKRCMFIHQNVSDEAALENMEIGLKSCVETLDMATKEAAESEDVPNIKQFDQVIAFDMRSDVQCIPQLWQGNAPMAKVNQKYSQKVLSTRQYFLQKSLKDMTKSYKTIEDIAVNMDDLWCGVLSEDFVFSFRNSLEKKAYLSLEKVLKEQIWGIDQVFEQKVYDICNDIFSKCETEKQLHEEKYNVTTETKQFITTQHQSVLRNLNGYFSHNEYQELTIQWKEKTEIQLQITVDDIFTKRQSIVDYFLHQQLVKIKTRQIYSRIAAALHQRSIILASKLKGKHLETSEIDSEFDNLWESVVNNSIDTTKSSPNFNLRQIFTDWLNSTFPKHPVLNKVLEQRNMLKSTASVEQLTGTFSITGIKESDFNLQTSLKSVMRLTTERPSSAVMLKQVNEMLDYLFGKTDEIITNLKQIDNEITETDVRKFLLEFQNLANCQFKKLDENIIVNKTIHVKVFVHVSHIACHVFVQHNNRYQDSHSITAQLLEIKRQCKDLFNNQLCEKTAPDCFFNIVESFLNNLIQDRLPMLIKNGLKPLLPSGKMTLVVTILGELVVQNDFQLFYDYINNPTKFAERWVKKTCELNLFINNNSTFRKLVLQDVQKYIDDLYEVLNNSENVLAETVNIDEWLDFFNKEVRYCRFSAEDFQMLKAQFLNNCHVNVKQFQSKLLEQMEKVRTKINSYLQSATADTVKWHVYNPYDELFQEVWGCNECCTFCGEPCMHETFGHAVDHECVQHKPKGLLGNRLNEYNIINLRTCSYDVATDKRSACKVFQYACSKQKDRDCPKKTHKFKEYKTILKTWDIKPNKKTEENVFWQWFIYKYKEDLKKQYGCEVDKVPKAWSKISQKDAIEYLQQMYRKRYSNESGFSFLFPLFFIWSKRFRDC